MVLFFWDVTPRNIPAERRPQLQNGGSLKTRTALSFLGRVYSLLSAFHQETDIKMWTLQMLLKLSNYLLTGEAHRVAFDIQHHHWSTEEGFVKRNVQPDTLNVQNEEICLVDYLAQYLSWVIKECFTLKVTPPSTFMCFLLYSYQISTHLA
jgi:hypothetical protein